MIEYEPDHERFWTFLNLCGIHVVKGDLSRKPKDWKRELMRERQFESPENLRFYLKLIHCIRYSKVPFLPSISNDDRKWFEEGNVINYGFAKQTFYSLILEEGYSKEDFKDFDEPFKPYIEEQWLDGKEKKKKSKKGTNLMDDQAINLDIFLWISINEYTELKLWQLDGFLAALKTCNIEHNG